jgi:CRP-like cAMP-binding protein
MMLSEFLKGKEVLAEKYPKDKILLEPLQENSKGVGVILTGSVEIWGGSNLNPIFRYRLVPGEFFGLTSLLNTPNSINAKAIEDETRVLYLDRKTFYEYTQEDPGFLSGILKGIIEQIQNTPPELIRAPDKMIQLDEILGAHSEEEIDKIRQKNLGIVNYLNNKRNRLVLPGEYVFREDEIDDSDIFLIMQGSITQYLFKNNEEIPIIQIFPGSLFGFLKNKNNQSHILRAKAGSSTAKLVGLDTDLLLKISKLDPDLAYSVLQSAIITSTIIELTMIPRSDLG